MRVGLIDVDMASRGKCTYPNLALMKLSAWHKSNGDSVEWYDPLLSGHMDLVYMSKVFSDDYTQDYQYFVDADKIVKGGSGYAIHIENGKEVYHKEEDPSLPDEVFHMFPDYELYQQFGISDTAYGFLTRGCPRGCDFCHVKNMQGRCVETVARLSEFWNGQKNISLMDPNLTASRDYMMHMQDLADSGAYVDFSQGLDIRMLTPAKTEMLNKVKWKRIHFAWDNPKDDLADKFSMLKDVLKRCNKQSVSAYCLTNFGSTHLEDLMRVMHLRSCHVQPYVMIYRKDTAPQVTRRLQRWVNMPALFWKYPTFEEYCKATYKKDLKK